MTTTSVAQNRQRCIKPTGMTCAEFIANGPEIVAAINEANHARQMKEQLHKGVKVICADGTTGVVVDIMNAAALIDWEGEGLGWVPFDMMDNMEVRK